MSETEMLKKAFVTIQKLNNKLKESQKAFEPIAIIGLGCRFPQVKNKFDFWELLVQGKNVISQLPEERWDLLKDTEEFINRDRSYAYWGSYLEDITSFDAYFFGLTPREAMRMDPQQRLLLEVAYEAFEDAGLSIDTLAGSNTGVFSSLYASQFGHMQKLESDLDALYLPTGNALSIAANRLSYLFDLRGPSVVLDTACSSSLMALHLACLNLQNKSCDIALVCGANINITPSLNLLLSRAKMLSPDGQCKTFDSKANGYVQGEGIGVIILKPLSNALRDKDRIYAVINSSVVNQDGKTNGMTAPNGLQQEQLLMSAFKIAKIEPQLISYIECHGTGTLLGDPIELQALGNVVSKNRQRQHPCFIGSVKANLGHLEPAAGMASIIKVALSLQYKQIPPQLNFDTPNPHISFDKYNFAIADKKLNWPLYGEKRFAGVSGFGFGGTNVHVVLSEIPQDEAVNTETVEFSKDIFVISAKNESTLNLLVNNWHKFLEKNPSLDFAQICYSSRNRRSHFDYRLAIITHSIEELSNALFLVLTEKYKSSENIFITSELNNDPLTLSDLSIISLHDLAKHYINNARINWSQYDHNKKFPNLDMPSYPWQHKKYWPPMKPALAYPAKKMNHPLGGENITSPLRSNQFKFEFDSNSLPELKDTYNLVHVGYYLEMLAFAVSHLHDNLAFTIHNLSFILALMIPDNKIEKVYLILEPLPDDGFEFHFYSLSDKYKWREHANGKLSLGSDISHPIDSIEKIKSNCTIAKPSEVLYKKITEMGMPCGESIRWTHEFWMNEKEILCQFVEPESCKKTSGFKLNIHPGIFDGCIQPIFQLLPDEMNHPFMASHFEKIVFYGSNPGPFYLTATLKNISQNEICGNLILTQENKKVIEFENVTLVRINKNLAIGQMALTEFEYENLICLNNSEQKEYIIQFLIKQIALLFSMPKEDIDLNQSLLNMGMDSLLSLVLENAIESSFKITSFSQLNDDITITQLADSIVGNLPSQTPINVAQNSWISYCQRRKYPKMRLFCFPFGGGGASTYRDWERDLPSEIEVCPIQLPGRENRLNEKPLNNIEILIDEIIYHLKDEFNLPYALFGHSFGSLIAYRLALKMNQLSLNEPSHLFVSAFPDPALPTDNLNNLLNNLLSININLFDSPDPFMTNLTDEQFQKMISIFAENGLGDYSDKNMTKDVMKHLLPIFIADMSIVKSYKHQDGSILNIPITVFSGEQDKWIPFENQLNWKKRTRSEVRFETYKGDHLFIKNPTIKKEILRRIASLLETNKDCLLSN